MKRYVTKKTKPIVKITLGLITASISLGTISVVTQQATAHASTVQTTHNHTSTIDSTSYIPNEDTCETCHNDS